MIKKLRNKYTILILGSCILISAFFYFTTKKVELTLGVFSGSNWDVPNSDGHKIIDDAIKQFEEHYPNVSITYESGILKEDYSLWLTSKIVEGEEPDIYMILGDDFNMLSSLGALHSLDSKILSDTSFDKNKYYESSLFAGQYQNTQYALPYESNPTLMFVNRTLLEQEGIEIPKNDWTLDDFYHICEQVTKDTDGNGVMDQFGFYNYTWQDAINSYGVNLFNEEGTESDFIQKAISEAIKWMQDLESLNQGILVNATDFDKGNVAFSPMLFSQYRTYKPYPWRIKKYSMFTWDCIKMPSVNNKDSKTQVSSLLFGMSSRTKHSTFAWEFLKELTYNTDTQKEVFRYSQGISPLKEVTQSSEALDILLEDANEDSLMDIAVLNEVMENAVHSTKFKKYEGALKIADYQINQMIQQHESVESSLMSLQQEINTYLKE